MSATDEFGHHEVLHMITVLRDMWDDWIETHPAVKENQNISDKANEVQRKISEFEKKWLKYSESIFL